jgi:hypothetical protein
MKNLLLKSMLVSLTLLISFFISAQDASLVPVITDDGAIMFSVSDNGLWAAGYLTAGGEHSNASIWNLETLERINLVSPGEPSAAYDVTDDGSMAVGAYNNKPAYWENGQWTMLPMPIENGIGGVYSVTPDGSKWLAVCSTQTGLRLRPVYGLMASWLR